MTEDLTIISFSTNTSSNPKLLEKLEQEKQERIAADKDLDNRKVDKREGYSLTKNDHP